MTKADQPSLIPNPNELPALLKSSDDPRLEQLSGRKEIRWLKDVMVTLAGQSAHGNRLLKVQHVLVAHLLGFFNPMIRSLRTFELASQSEHVQDLVDIPRICRSTHSDFLAMADPNLLAPLIRALRAKVPDLCRRDGELHELLDKAVIFDGSYFEVPITVAWAMRGTFGIGKKEKDKRHPADAGDRGPRKRFARIRLNVHYCSRSGVPEGVSVDGGEGSEGEAMGKHLDKGVTYVADRGPFSYRGVDKIVANGSHYVLRLKKDIPFIALEERPLSREGVEHGVTSDRIGHFKGSRKFPRPSHLSREIIISDPQRPDRPIRLVTDLLDTPAHILGMLYRERWQIELFFRWLKVFNNFDHLVTHSREGMTFAFYVMIIALLLHAILHGRPAGKYDILVYQLSLSRGRSDPGLLAGLARLEREKELARARYARKKAIKKLL